MKKVVIILVLSLFTLIQAQALETNAEDDFIVLFIHGFAAQKDNPIVPEQFFENKPLATGNTPGKFPGYIDFDGNVVNFDPVVNLRSKGITNVFDYTLVSGYDIGKAKEAYPDPANLTYMTDVFMREIGDYNTGSAVLGRSGVNGIGTQQCFFALAKCEWVYRKLEYLKNVIGIANPDYEPAIKTLLLYGPRFYDLLVSASWIESKLNKVGLPAAVNKSALAEEIYELVTATGRYANTTGVPHKFRIVAHSMGGMFAMRFLTEEGQFGYYQKYSEYSDEDFNADIGNAPFNSRYTDMRNALNNDARLKEIFREERENVVDKVITLDSPLPGSPLKDVWKMIKEDFFLSGTGGNLVWFTLLMDAAAVGNIALSSIELIAGSIMLICPFTIELGLELIGHATTCIVVDTGWIVLSVIGGAELLLNLVAGVIIDPIEAIFCPDKTKEEKKNLLPDDFFPPGSSLFPELAVNGSLSGRYNKPDTPIPLQKPGGDPIEITAMSFAGPATPISYYYSGEFKDFGSNLALQMLQGNLQQKLVLLLQLAIGADQYNYFLYNMDQKTLLECMIPFVLDLLGFKTMEGSVLMPKTASAGIGVPIIEHNGNANMFELDVTTAGYKALRSQIENPEYNFPQQTWFKMPLVLDLILGGQNRFVTEFLILHGWDVNFLNQPILKQWTWPEKGNANTIVFENNAMVRTFSTLKTINPSFHFPQLGQEQRNSIEEWRNYYNFFMYSNVMSKKSANSVAVLEADPIGNAVTCYAASTKDPFRGVTSALVRMEEPDASNPYRMRNKKIEALDYMLVNNYVRVLPLSILDNYKYLDVEYSINDEDWRASTQFADVNASNVYADIWGYASAIKDQEAQFSSLLIDNKGQVLLVSPHFKEGFNQIAFRLTDPFGDSVIKEISVRQLTVPPFLKLLQPTMNEFVKSRSVDIVIQAEDASGALSQIPNWFDSAAFTLQVDDQAAPSYTKGGNFTANFSLFNLDEGQHMITCRMNVEAFSVEYSWAFWVDVSAPVIRFPRKLIFSNVDEHNTSGVSVSVEDTLPFRIGGSLSSVDTVFLAGLNLSVSQYGQHRYTAIDEVNTRVGTFSRPWNGWVEGNPLPHGIYSLDATAVDRVGNANEGHSDLIIDSRAPFVENLSLNQTLINLQAGLLKLDYRIGLDQWEEKGFLDVSFANTSSHEQFTQTVEAANETNESYTVAYFTEGVSVLKDGVYEVSVATRDELENKGTPTVFSNIVVDRTKPSINNVYANPFVVNPSKNTVKLQFNSTEEKDAQENASASLGLEVAVANQYGEVVSTITPYTGEIAPGATFDHTFNLPADLADGKYFLTIAVTDKNGNTATDQAAFIKNAMPPEITYPAENEILKGVTSIYGNVYDPVWSNSIPFLRYELYYQAGDFGVPQNLNDLSSWDSAGFEAPQYQRKASWPLNVGQFTIEGSNVLGILDTSALPEGLVTLLVVAEEQDGYRIGTIRTFHIMRDTDIQSVSVQIDPAFTSTTQVVDFGSTQSVTIPYDVTHSVTNPVDIYTCIKDSSGAVVKRTSALNLNSVSIKGIPAILPGDKGVFIYQNTDNRFYIVLKNDNTDQSQFMVMASSQGVIANPVDENGNSINVPIVNEGSGTRMVIVRRLGVNEQNTIGFTLSGSIQLTLQSTANNSIPITYVGSQKQAVESGYLTIYEGSSYPPVVWDGKDEWGRFVYNGTLTIDVEAIGKKGGYGADRCRLQVMTPIQFGNIVIDNKWIQPGVPSMEKSTCSFVFNKAANLSIQVLDKDLNVVADIIPNPPALSGRGKVQFTWLGRNNLDQFVPDGTTCSYKISCEPLDGSGVVAYDSTTNPILGGITVAMASALDPGLQTQILPFADAGTFNGRQLVKGDTRYKVEVDPKGQYLPEKNVTLDYKGEGTQVVKAYPELNYVSALRYNFEELWAQVRLSKLNLYAQYTYSDGTWGTHYGGTTPEFPLNLTFNDRIVSFDLDSNSLCNAQPLRAHISTTGTVTLPGRISHKVGQQKDCIWIIVWWCGDWYDVYKPLKLQTITSPHNLTGEVVLGKDYMGPITWSNVSVTNWSAPNNDSAYTNNTNQTVTVTVSFDITVNNKFSQDAIKRLYYSYADGIAVTSPDIPVSGASPYAHPSKYVSTATPAQDYVLLSPDVFTSTNLDRGSPADSEVSTSGSYWRRKPRLVFYYNGETYPNLLPDEAARTAFDAIKTKTYDLSVNFGGGTAKTGVPAEIKTARYAVIPGGFTSQTFEAPDYSKVKFTLRKDSQGAFIVRPESIAEDRILYPYLVDKGNFEYPHQIWSPDLNIPTTYINTPRTNNVTSNSFIVPEFEQGGTKNVYFKGDAQASDTFSLTGKIVYEPTDKIVYDNKPGYEGLLSLQRMNDQAQSGLPASVNIKKWYITSLDSDSGDVQFTGIPSEIENKADSVSGVEIGDSNIQSIAGSAWSGSEDPQNIPGGILSSGFKAVDTDELNRYGSLHEERISSFYPDTGAIQNHEKAMFLDEGDRVDNPSVVIQKSLRDYSGTNHAAGYTVSVKGIDGNPYKGLVAENVAAFGKGLKLSDGFVIKKSEDSIRALVPVMGNATGAYELYYLGTDNQWKPIPVYNPDPVKNVLTYWDVTGLNGLYTLRLVSRSADNEHINVDLSEVYIGEKVIAETDDFVVPSTTGEVKIVFPAGSLSEETVVSVDNVTMDEIKDIADLPDIAPVGKVIKLSPEGLEFDPQSELPQLSFIYNRTEIDEQGLNPSRLFIYNLKSDGSLEVLNTIKQLVSAEYDANGTVTGETILWDSRTSRPEDLIGLDYTYVKAWAVLTHFSYYVVLEGNISDMPKVNENKQTFTTTTISITGTGVADSDIRVFVSDSGKYTVIPGNDPAAWTTSDRDGKFTLSGIELRNEGTYYLYVGYPESEAWGYRKVIVYKDSVPPVVSMGPTIPVISPNNDRFLDSTTLYATADEDGSMTMTLSDTHGEVVTKTVSSIKDEPVQFLIDGKDGRGSSLVDGLYSIVVRASDRWGNTRTADDRSLAIDTTPPELNIALLGSSPCIISPANGDGIYDSVSAECSVNEASTVSIWMQKEGDRIQVVADRATTDTPFQFAWNGANNGVFVKDGTYTINASAVDGVGNKATIQFGGLPVSIDNTPPSCTLDYSGENVLLIPSTFEYTLQANEPAAYNVRVVAQTTGAEVYQNATTDYSLSHLMSLAIPNEWQDDNYTFIVRGRDAAGNIGVDSTLVFELTHDNEPPALTQPLDLESEATAVLSSIDIGSATALDASEPVTIVNDAPALFPLGETIVTWYATDRFGNRSTAEQKITVVDTTPPVLTTPPDITVDSTTYYNYVEHGEATATDIFEVVSITNNAPAVYYHGVTDILWQAIDANGNQATVIQHILVKRPDADTVPPEWFYQDIGAPALSGTTTQTSGVYTLQGSDLTQSNTTDELHFMYKPVKGDCTIYAKIPSVDALKPGAWAGVLMREDLSGNGRMAQASFTSEKRVEFGYRINPNDAKNKKTRPGKAPCYLKLVREGNMFSAYESKDGNHWKMIGNTVIIPMKMQIFIGLGVCSGNPAELYSASFLEVYTEERPRVTGNLPIGWSTEDVGSPQFEGSAGFEGASLIVNGSGSGIDGTSDQLRFVYTPIAGDCEVTAQVLSQTDTNKEAKAGVMIRASLAETAPYVAITMTPSKKSVAEWRTADGGVPEQKKKSDKLPQYVKIIRSGSTFRMYQSEDGTKWKQVGNDITLSMGEIVYAGFCVTSTEINAISRVDFAIPEIK